MFGVEANYNYLVDLATSTSCSSDSLLRSPTRLVHPASGSDRRLWRDADRQGRGCRSRTSITFRGRAGWATGDFLPYIFGGLAVGRMDISRTVTSAVQAAGSTTTSPLGVTTTTFGPVLPVPAQSQTQSQERTNNFVAGWTGGLGLEYMLRFQCLRARRMGIHQVHFDGKHGGHAEQPARRDRLQVLTAAVRLPA